MTTDLLASIDAGFTLPSEWYSDPAIFREEQRKILRRSWHFVTSTDRLAEPGDVRRAWANEIQAAPVRLAADEHPDRPWVTAGEAAWAARKL